VSRRKTWDVDDPNRLRRSLQTNDQYVDDLYYHLEVSPHEFALEGSTSHVIVEEFWSGVEYAFAGPGDSSATLHWPLWWRYGRAAIKTCWWHESGVGTGISVRIALFGRECGSTDTYELIDDTSTYPTTSTGVAQAFAIELTTDVKERGDNELFGFMVDRQPSDPGDDANAAFTMLGAVITWKPEPR